MKLLNRRVIFFFFPVVAIAIVLGVILAQHDRQTRSDDALVRTDAAQPTSPARKYRSPQVRTIVEANEHIIELMPFHNQSPVVLDAVVREYVKHKGIKYFRHPYDLNTVLFDIIADFPDSKLGGYAASQFVINDDTIFNQNIDIRVGNIIRDHPNSPTFRCLLKRYLESPLPEANERNRIEFAKSLIEDPRASHDVRCDCLDFMIAHCKSANDHENEAVLLEKLLDLDKQIFLEKRCAERLAVLYNSCFTDKKLNAYARLSETCPPITSEPDLSAADELRCRVAVSKCQSGIGSREETRQAEFWNAYFNNNVDALVRFANTPGYDKLHFIALITAGDLNRDTKTSRDIFARILDETEPYTVYSTISMHRIGGTLRNDEDPAAVASSILNRIHKDPDSASALACELYRGLGMNKQYVAASQKCLADHPTGRYADRIHYELFEYFYKTDPNLEECIEHGYALFSKGQNPNQYAHILPTLVEMSLLIEKQELALDIYSRTVPKLLDRAIASRLNKMMALACLSGNIEQRNIPAGHHANQRTNGAFDTYFAKPVTITAESCSEIMNFVPNMAMEAVIYSVLNNVKSVQDVIFKSAALSLYEEHPDSCSNRMLLRNRRMTESKYMKALESVAYRQDPMNTFLLMGILGNQQKRYARKIFADDVTSATQAYRLYCLSKYTNGTADSDELLYASIFINKSNKVYLLAESEKTRDHYFINYILHQLALTQQEAGDFIKARRSYEKMLDCPEYKNSRVAKIHDNFTLLMYAYYSKKLFEEGCSLQKLGFYDIAKESYVKSSELSGYLNSNTRDPDIRSMLEDQVSEAQNQIHICSQESQTTTVLSRETIDKSVYELKRDWPNYKKQSTILDGWVETNSLKSEQWGRISKRKRVNAAMASILSEYEKYLLGQPSGETYATVLNLGELYEIVYGHASCVELLERYRKSLAHNEFNLDLMTRLTMEYEQASDFPKAASVYDAIFNRSPIEKDAVRAGCNLFRIYLINDKDMSKAIQISELMLLRFPDSKQARSTVSRIGIKYLELKQPEDAMRQFMKCMQHASDNNEIIGLKFSIAQCYLQKQAYDKCRDLLTEIINMADRDEQKSKAHMFIGYTYLLEQKYMMAKAEYGKVIQEFPNSDDVKVAAEYMSKLSKISQQNNRR